jgi:hypothetical protein
MAMLMERRQIIYGSHIAGGVPENLGRYLNYTRYSKRIYLISARRRFDYATPVADAW